MGHEFWCDDLVLAALRLLRLPRSGAVAVQGMAVSTMTDLDIRSPSAEVGMSEASVRDEKLRLWASVADERDLAYKRVKDFLRAWDNHIFTSELGNVVQESQVLMELDGLRSLLGSEKAYKAKVNDV